MRTFIHRLVHRTFRQAGLIAIVSAALLAAPIANAEVFNPKRFVLENGLELVVIEDRRRPAIAHYVYYKVGAMDETPGKTGLAHFLEHLMFKGTDKLAPGEFSQTVSRNGGRDNAFTSRDVTGYHQVIASPHLRLVMEMEADRMTGLRLTEAESLAERDVVLEERLGRVDSRPSGVLGETLNAALYLSHPGPCSSIPVEQPRAKLGAWHLPIPRPSWAFVVACRGRRATTGCVLVDRNGSRPCGEN